MAKAARTPKKSIVMRVSAIHTDQRPRHTAGRLSSFAETLTVRSWPLPGRNGHLPGAAAISGDRRRNVPSVTCNTSVALELYASTSLQGKEVVT